MLLVAIVLGRFVAADAHAWGPWEWPIGDTWTGEYGADGLFFRSDDGNWLVHPQLRFQTRYSYPFDSAPTTKAALETADTSDLRLRRSRFKLAADIGAPWLKFHAEFEFRDTVLLDMRGSWEKFEGFRVRLGQWKPEYNRERRDSSGKQEFVDRSILNPVFTIDRQVGLMFYGRWFKQTRADLSWWSGVFTGAGRGRSKDAGRPLVMTRLQWNPFGRVVKFSQVDIPWSEEPKLSIAAAFVDGRSPYTAYSGDGGGELPGFAPGKGQQYGLTQVMVDYAYRWRGISAQGEGHWKRINDHATGRKTRMWGTYLQAGFFPGAFSDFIPDPLEFAVRIAVLDPDTGTRHDDRQELSFAANWFFNGHRNKLTLDGRWLRVNDPSGAGTRWAVRLQWDVSI